MYFAEVQKIYQLKNDKTFIKTLLKKKIIRFGNVCVIYPLTKQKDIH